MNTANPSYRELIQDDRSLKEFLAALADFNGRFCDQITAGSDFTLKLEVHGNKGELIHTRTSVDSFRRPPGVEKRVEGKLRRELAEGRGGTQVGKGE